MMRIRKSTTGYVSKLMCFQPNATPKPITENVPGILNGLTMKTTLLTMEVTAEMVAAMAMKDSRALSSHLPPCKPHLLHHIISLTMLQKM